jgi:hypothetical protein
LTIAAAFQALSAFHVERDGLSWLNCQKELFATTLFIFDSVDTISSIKRHTVFN